MRLHIRRAAHVRGGSPETRALITGLRALGGFRVEIRFQDDASPGSQAIPYGCCGGLLNYTWGPEKITDYTALTQAVLMIRSPYVLDLPPEAEGKFLSCTVRWQNIRGKTGPVGKIHHSVIA